MTTNLLALAQHKIYLQSRIALLVLNRVRNPDVVSLEHFEHFLKHAHAAGITLWLAGLKPDLLESFQRLNFSALLPDDHVFAQGASDESATLAAVKRIRQELGTEQSSHGRPSAVELMTVR